MKRNRVKALVGLCIAIGLLLWGAMYRNTRIVTGSGKVVEIADPIVVQATAVGAIKVGDYGVLTGEPAKWGDTAGKECPT